MRASLNDCIFAGWQDVETNRHCARHRSETGAALNARFSKRGGANLHCSQSRNVQGERAMDWYSIVKFLHIASATLWVGGGFALMLLAVRADRAGNIEGVLQAMRATGELGNRFFAPMSMLTLLFGLIMCGFWVGFFDLWGLS